MKNLDLLEIRKQLDEVDAQMVRLFEERMALSMDVAKSKLASGKAVYDGQREKEKLAALEKMTEGDFNRQAVRELFTQLMTIGRKRQYQYLAEHGKALDLGFCPVDSLKKEGVRVVYQGVEGAYSHGAAIQFFGADTPMYHVPSWEDAMVEVEQGRADYAVLPIENSSAGAVSNNYDLLMKHSNYIVAETQLRVTHALLGLPQARLDDIKTVYSHPQALMQCSEYLNSHKEWSQISVENTAVAARKITADGKADQAAVASEIAGSLYGLKVLAPAINYNKNNVTRFIIISPKAVYCRDAGKVSLCFEAPHISGSLYNMLGNFIYNQVNMLRIESRPIEGRSWEYRFFVDIEGSLEDAAVQNALKGIAEEAASLRILGTY